MRDCRNLQGEQVVHNKERIMVNCCSEIIYRNMELLDRATETGIF